MATESDKQTPMDDLLITYKCLRGIPLDSQKLEDQGAKIEKLEKEKKELRSLLDFYVQQFLDSSLELRIKAANEAEAAGQLKLAAAEKEIADLRSKLDASERNAMEIKEAIKIIGREAETYMTKVEKIDLAFEDMQTQNQHLLQQLVSQSATIKQARSSLLFQKQVFYKKLQQINSSYILNVKIVRGEEQAHNTLFPHAKETVAENRVHSIDLEATKQELMDVAEQDLKWLRSVDFSKKEFEQTQQKLLELRNELDTERKAMGIEEEIKIKDGEAETYMAKIEAYEETETQNQHLLQQLTERADAYTNGINGGGRRCSQLTLGYPRCEHHLEKARLKSMSSIRGRQSASRETNQKCVDSPSSTFDPAALQQAYTNVF